MKAEDFIQRWRAGGGSGRANYQLYLSELCDVLEVPRPKPAGPDSHDYVFERPVKSLQVDGTTRSGCIDLYKRGCFMLIAVVGESGRGAVNRRSRNIDWDYVVLAAKNRAEALGRALPGEEKRPPFLLVASVGVSIDVYADFSLLGIAYTAYPGPNFHRILVSDLRRPEIVERLRSIWMDPGPLDPSEMAAVELG